MTKAILVSKTMVDELYVEQLIEENPPEDIKDLEFYRNLKNKPEQLMIFIARVSSPKQDNPEYEKLLRYCWVQGHFSVFEQVNLTMEVETDLATSMQLLRHRSLCFQQLSRRYSSDNIEFVHIEAREQNLKNRQDSTDTLNSADKVWFQVQKQMLEQKALNAYNEAIQRNIAKETARYLLPTSLKTKLYVTGNLRNFIHYVLVREKNGTQQEHKDLALAIKKELKRNFPVSYEAVWPKKEVSNEPIV